MTLPNFVVSFDPGGTPSTWAYCVSTVIDRTYMVLETGFAPVFEELSSPDFTPFFAMRDRLLDTYQGRVDLVAERFMGRGFASKIAEYIPFTLGVWASTWRGNVKLITAAQWKVPMKKYGKAFLAPSKRYENWWEWTFESHTTPEARKKKAVHVQDATGIGYWYYRFALKQDHVNLCSSPDVLSPLQAAS